MRNVQPGLDQQRLSMGLIVRGLAVSRNVSLMTSVALWFLASVGTVAAGILGQRLSQEFACSANGPQTFTVPDSVTSLSVEAHGGRGGFPDPNTVGSESGAGGFGAVVNAALTVTPGETLTVWVGCAGDARAGFGGGGDGGISGSRSPRKPRGAEGISRSGSPGMEGGTGGSASAILSGDTV